MSTERLRVNVSPNKVLAGKSSIFLIPGHRKMLFRTTLGDLKSRYAGSLLGFGWTILTPFVLLSIYTVIYLVVFKVRAPNLTPIMYVLTIFSGLVPFLMTSESITVGVGSIVANRSILANTVFPVDLLPVKSVFASQATMLVGMSAILIILIFTGNIAWTALLLPFIWMLHVVGLIGLVWILALANLVLRDISNVISLGMVVVMVLTPIAYTREMVPGALRLLLYINPLAYFVLAYQDILVRGTLPSLGTFAFIIIFSVGLFLLGGQLFYRMKQVMLEYA